MNWLIWNIRGVNQKECIDHLKVLLRTHTINFIVLLEPMMPRSHLNRLCFSLGFPFWLHRRGESPSLDFIEARNRSRT